MIETRTKKIKNVVLKKQDLKNIFNYVNSQNLDSKKQQNHSTLNIKVKCNDDTVYDSDSDEFFNDGDVMDIKKCQQVIMSYVDYKLDRRIELSIDSDGHGCSNLTIRGCDKDWVNGRFNDLVVVFDSLKRQDNFYLHYKTFLLHLFAVSIGVMFYYILFRFFVIFAIGSDGQDLNDKGQMIRNFFIYHQFFKYVFLLFVFWMFGHIFGASYHHASFYKKYYPPVEFDFGPAHNKIEKIRRKQLSFFVLIIFAPTIIMIVYDVVKNFYFK